MVAPLVPSDIIVEDDSSFNNLMKIEPTERVNGINLATFGTICECQINGISLGTIGNITSETNGITGAIFLNWSDIHNGMVFGAFTESNLLNGIQIGVRNEAYKSNGLQIGLLNISKKMNGIQIGLWNNNGLRKLPFINWNFKRNAH